MFFVYPLFRFALGATHPLRTSPVLLVFTENANVGLARLSGTIEDVETLSVSHMTTFGAFL